MSSILATVDIQDDATEKVGRIKDALTDLAETQQRIAAGARELSGTLQGSVTSMQNSSLVTKQAADEMRRLADQYTAVVPVVGGVSAALSSFYDHFKATADALAQQRVQLQQLAGTLTQLALAAKDGSIPLGVQAGAMETMAEAARRGVPGLEGSAKALQAMTDQLVLGTPLTAAQTQSLDAMAESVKVANREVMGLGSATEVLAAQETALVRTIRETYGSLTLLTTQLTAGQKVTKLQSDALKELADRARQGNGFTKEQADSIDRLAKSMTTGTVATKAQADELRRLTTEYAETNKAALGLQSTNEQTISGFERYQLAAAALAATLALVAGESLGLLKESGMLAARIETLGVVMSIISKNAHLSGQEMNVQTESVKRLGITTQEARNSVNQFVQANLKLADTSKIARVAQDLAVISGQNSSEAFQTLTNAIQTQQPMLLRQFGIVTGLDQVYAEYAKTVGKTVKELDGMDKKQAFVNLILKEGEKAAGAYEAAMSTSGKQIGSFARYVEEAKLALGKGLLPVMLQGVELATALLKVWIGLPPVVQNIVTAILAAVVAMAAFGAVIAGAQFLGIIGLFTKLAGAVAAYVAMTAEGVAANTALAYSFGLLELSLGAVALVLGAIVAAWVLYSKQQEISVEKYTEHAAKLEAENRALETSFEKYQKSALAVGALTDRQRTLNDISNKTHAQTVDLASVTGKLESEQGKLNSAIGKMIALDPAHAAMMTGQVSGFLQLAGAIGVTIAAKRKSMEQDLVNAKAQLSVAQAEEDAARKASAAAIAKQTAAMKYVDAAKARGGDSGYLNQNLSNATSEVADLSKAVDEATAKTSRFGPMVKMLELALNPGAQAIQNSASVKDQVDGLKATLSDLPERLKVAKRALEESIATPGKTTEQLKKLREQLKEFPKSVGDLMKFPDTQKLDAFLTDMNDKWDIYRKKQEADGKKYLDGYKNYTEKLTGLTKTERFQFAALNDALGKSGLSHEEYNRILEEGAPVLRAYAKAPEGLVTSFKHLQKGYADLLAAGYEAELGKRLSGLTKQFADLDLASRESITSTTAAFHQTSLDMGSKLVDQRKAQNDQIFNLDRSNYERLVVAKWDSTKQEIYNEQKRVAEIIKGSEREQEARQKEVNAARKAVDQKALLMMREIEDKAAKMRLDRDLDDAAAVHAIQLNQKMTDLEKASAVRGVRDATAVFETSIAKYEQLATARVGIMQAAAQQELDVHQQTVDQMGAADVAANQRQLAASGQFIKEIKQRYDELHDIVRNVGIAMFQNVSEAFVRGMHGLIEGTVSAKDALVGIWQSIKQTLFGVFDDLLKKWLSNMAKMAMAKIAGNVVAGAGSVLGTLGTTVGMAGVAGGSTPGMPGVNVGIPQIPGGSGSVGIMGLKGMGGKLLGGAIGGMVGGEVGYGVGQATGSYAKGALAGGASGAVTGAAFGGPIGALIGGAIGLVAGLFGAGKARREAEQARDAYIKAGGGIEEVTRKAKEAGISLDKMFQAKNAKALQKALEEINKALELQKAKDTLATTYNEMQKLDKIAQLVGFDMKDLYNSKSIEEFNVHQERLNKLLEAQKKRLDALMSASQGSQAFATGFMQTLDRNLTDIAKKMGKAEGEALAEAYKKAQEHGFKGTQNDFLRDQARTYQTAKEGDPKLKTWLSAGTMDAFARAQKQAQIDFTALGAAAAATFAQIIHETGDVVQAMAAIGPTLDILIQAQKDWGLESDATLTKLLGFRQVIKDNEDIFNSLSGITQILHGLSEAGGLTQDTFNALGDSAANQLQRLTDRGVDADQALLGMQPTLQALWEAQKQFGFQADDTTQALINQGVEAGLVGANQQSINQKILDVLLLIAVALGATLPQAYLDAAAAAEGSGRRQDTAARGPQGALDGVNGRLRDVRQRYLDAADAADEFGRRGEAAATGVAEGHSPTGLKQIVFRLHESRQLMNLFRDEFVRHAATIEAVAGDTLGAPSVGKGAAVRAAEAGGGAPVSITVVQEGPKISISALDQANMQEAWREKLVPEYLRHLEANTDQIAEKTEEAIRRHRRKVS